jgi:hypothetical protein
VRPYLKNNLKQKKGWGMTQVVEYLFKTLSSNPSTGKKKEEKEEEEEVEEEAQTGHI